MNGLLIFLFLTLAYVSYTQELPLKSSRKSAEIKISVVHVDDSSRTKTTTTLTSTEADTTSPLQVKIVPNPASKLMKIEITSPKEEVVTIEFATVKGDVILKNESVVIKKDVNTLEYDVSSFVQGTYYCRIVGESFVHKTMFQVER